MIRIEAKTNTSKAKEATTTVCLFSKEQLKASQKFLNRSDLLEILLENGKRYSFATVEKMIEEFMKGKVK